MGNTVISGQLRLVNTQHGQITYTLVFRPVKHMNLCVRKGGEVCLSVPGACAPARADELVREKSAWIQKHLDRQNREHLALSPEPDEARCRELLCAAVRRVYPLVKPFGVPVPEIRLRSLKSQWGNCHYKQRYITLNLLLARCPDTLQDYVALHELVHFVHPNHGEGFYNLMGLLMPGWKCHRAELRRYEYALER